MKSNNEIIINDIADLKYGKSLPDRERKAGPIPVYGSGGIGGYHDKAIVQKGIIIGRKGSVGTVRFSKTPFYPIDTVFFVDEVKGENDLKFFYYFLQSIGLSNFDSDAAVPGLNRNLVHKLKAIIPEPKTQQRIASILSAYDDLIEVNNQRIKLLEETARELYKEWFVRMRFPGYKKAKFVKGVPEGWEVKRVADVFDILGGGTPSTEKPEYWSGNVNWFTPTDITGVRGIFLSESSSKISEKGLKESSAKLFPSYSIMMTSRATIGAVGINTTPGCTNQGFITCLPNKNMPYTFIYFWILLNKEVFEMLGTGSTFLEITKGTFRKIKMLSPKLEMLNRFHKMSEPMFQQIEILQQQNIQLRQIRDRLLPRLVSGKLCATL
jgi:type I restriction enzyme S subunit